MNNLILKLLHSSCPFKYWNEFSIFIKYINFNFKKSQMVFSWDRLEKH